MTDTIRHTRAGLLIFVLFLLLILPPVLSERASDFEVRRVGRIVSYTDNAFSVTAPEEGELRIRICNDTDTFRMLTMHVLPGDNTLRWDGCGYNSERLQNLNYHIVCTLTGQSGQEYSHTFDSMAEYGRQALLFALSSSETLSLSEREGWFLEAKTVVDGTLCMEWSREGESEAAYTFRREVKGNQVSRITFRAMAGAREFIPGKYTLKVWEISNPAYSDSMTVNVISEPAEVLPLAETGRIMPREEDDDGEIWHLMTQPAVVVDIGYTDHQQVYEQPAEDSAVLGTLHGQTQALEVVEIAAAWARVRAYNHEEGELVDGWVPAGKLKTVQPRTEYGILIDKSTQTMTVFQEGRRISSFLICTGRMEEGELYQETAAGSFLTGLHRVDYSTNGKKYDFVIQYDGGNLMHQIPYAFGKGRRDFTEGAACLGARASHACLRLPAVPDESGINAYWIWTHIPYHTRIIILDDPLLRRNHAAMARGEMPEGNERIDLWDDSCRVAEEDDEVIRLTFGGDAVIGGRENYFSRNDSLMAFVRQYGMDYPFSALQEIFGTDDVTSVNLECVLQADREGEDPKKTWRFRGLPEYTEILTAGSVELVNLANNHTIDYGESGLVSTRQALAGQVAACGGETPVVLTVRGHRIGFGGCRETAYIQDPSVIEKDIRSLRAAGCEVVIYQCHWGKEYSAHRSILQEAMARACVRAGADLVIGHHPHVVQGVEYVEGIPVVYSLGNLCFGGTIDLTTYEAMLARVEIRFGEKPALSLRLIPILTSSTPGVNDFRPMPADGDAADGIRNQVLMDSFFPER